MLLTFAACSLAEKGWQDLSVAVAPGRTPTFPGDPVVAFEWVMSLDRGQIANLSSLRLGAHSGTHIDAPLHFVKGGASVDKLDLSALVGRARIVECSPDAAVIDAAELRKHDLGGSRRILFKTRNSSRNLLADPKFHTDFTYIAPDAAKMLADAGVRLVGIDYLSAEKYGAKTPQTHLILLGRGIPIVEGLDLHEAKAGDYDLICLPIKLEGREAAPARVVVRPLEVGP